MFVYDKTINIVTSFRNREAKSAYSISACGIRGFVLDCDPGGHSTSLTAFLEEIMKSTRIEPRKHDRLKAIELKTGDITLPPIIMNKDLGINVSVDNLSSDLTKFYNEGNDNFSFLLKKVDISQFQGNIVGSISPQRDSRVYYNHVFLDCSGHLLSNGPSTLKRLIMSIKDIRASFWNFKIILHYIIRAREVVSQEYYNENSVEKRRAILLYCIQKDLSKRLDILSEESKELDDRAHEGKSCLDESPPMAGLIHGIVLVFNLYNENKRMKDKLFGNMLEKDLENISNSLEQILPVPCEIYKMRECKKLLENSKTPHQRIFDYLTASVNELPNKCLERIG